MQTDSPSPSGNRPHAQTSCCEGGIVAVERACAERGLRLTASRREVLEILNEAHLALGAYEILARLDSGGKAPQPPSVYRSLTFLVENGFAHRIESMNAFIACAHPAHDHRAGFLICRACRRVSELSLAARGPDVFAAGAAEGFTIESLTVEALGLCPPCREAGDHAA